VLKVGSLLELLKDGVRKGVFPGAVAGIYYKGRTYVVASGYASLTPFLEPVSEDSLFDLASLTKPLALGLTLIYLLQNDPRLDLESPLSKYLETTSELSKIPLFRFLNHTSGLKAWHPFYQEKPLILEKIFRIIEKLPLEYGPGKGSLYSDLNFYLFTYLLEKIFESPFEVLFERFKESLGLSKKALLTFNPLEKGIDQEVIVPTSLDPETRKLLRGVVEDENTRALSGVSGVAGLFGNVYGVFEALLVVLKAYYGEKSILSSELVRYFVDFRDPASDFALTFMKPSKSGYSAFGGVFSEKSFGHLGFTGCSFIVDPDRTLIVVLLTNRVHPQRENEAIKEFRPLFHQKVIEALS